MKMKRKIKIGNVISLTVCALSAAALCWFAFSVFTVKSAKSVDNELPSWNYFAIIQEIS